MTYKRMFILVEGDDDERFFDEIVKPKLEKSYIVTLWKYAQKKEKKIREFLNSVGKMGADYIYVGDIDHFPCVTAKKEKVQTKLKNLDKKRIVVIIKEIESWYLAGLSDEKAKQLKISSFKTTDSIIKEQFDNLIPKQFDSRIDFMAEILKYFSMDIAKQKNKSFKYFVCNYI